MNIKPHTRLYRREWLKQTRPLPGQSDNLDEDSPIKQAYPARDAQSYIQGNIR